MFPLHRVMKVWYPEFYMAPHTLPRVIPGLGISPEYLIGVAPKPKSKEASKKKMEGKKEERKGIRKEGRMEGRKGGRKTKIRQNETVSAVKSTHSHHTHTQEYHVP